MQERLFCITFKEHRISFKEQNDVFSAKIAQKRGLTPRFWNQPRVWLSLVRLLAELFGHVVLSL